MKVLSTEAKAALVSRMAAGERVSDISKETGVLRKSLYEWRAAYRALGAAGLNRKRGRKVGWKRAEAGRAASAPSSSPDAVAAAARPGDQLAQAEARIAELERLIGQQQADLDFFSQSLAPLGRDDPERGCARLYAVIEDVIADQPQGFAHDQANTRRLCALAEVSRAGFYRRRGPHPAARKDADLRDLIYRIALADRHYGYRRVKQELFHQDVGVNLKRVATVWMLYPASISVLA